MLFREQLDAELKKRIDEFHTFAHTQASDLKSYLARLSLLEALSYSEIEAKFAEAENIGAFPSAEIEAEKTFNVPFKRTWQNHQQARAWASEILDSRTTFAADGSQIYAGKESSAPVAAIQIGWFENPHDPGEPYEKNARFEILTPADLFKDQEDPMNPDIRVEERRYLGEVARIGEFLEKKRGWKARGERMPLAFFDNPLLVPFSQKGLQKSFLEATVSLVELSQNTGVPLVGFVDRSFSRDLLTMLEHFESAGRNQDGAIYDASLLFATLASWGDRTCFCYSKRRGLNAFDDRATGRSRVGFTYLQTTSNSQPARLDIPSWVYEAGLLNEMIDIVRAECVIGVGYPYALETADQTAVIAARDREVFFRALQEFATRGKLDFSVTRKSESKNRRR